ncbi:hypothetical protein Hanom_Chr16g01487951 [Helianthus anomalus]
MCKLHEVFHKSNPNPYHQPKNPQFKLQQVAVEYINLVAPVATTPLSLYLSSRTVNLHRQKRQHSRNQLSPSTFNIMYRGFLLGRGSVPVFFQPAHSTDAADLVKDALVNDCVGLRIIGDVNAEIRILGLTSPSVQVSCLILNEGEDIVGCKLRKR